MSAVVYGLFRADACVYVGQTSLFKQRKWSHLENPKSQFCGLGLEMRTLENVDDIDAPEARESFWIARMLTLGHALLNRRSLPRQSIQGDLEIFEESGAAGDLQRYLSACGKRGGSRKSAAKTAAARLNAKRPRKKKSDTM